MGNVPTNEQSRPTPPVCNRATERSAPHSTARIKLVREGEQGRVLQTLQGNGCDRSRRGFERTTTYGNGALQPGGRRQKEGREWPLARADSQRIREPRNVIHPPRNCNLGVQPPRDEGRCPPPTSSRVCSTTQIRRLVPYARIDREIRRRAQLVHNSQVNGSRRIDEAAWSMYPKDHHTKGEKATPN